MFKIGLPFQFHEQKSTLKKYSHMSTKIHDYSLQEFETEKKKKGHNQNVYQSVILD